MVALATVSVAISSPVEADGMGKNGGSGHDKKLVIRETVDVSCEVCSRVHTGTSRRNIP